jgi:hypothetical protein
MELKRIYTSSEYSFPEDFDSKKIALIEEDIEKMGEVINGKIWITEYIPNKHHLTPSHIVENWENIAVELTQ